jgi:hypothetical protein
MSGPHWVHLEKLMPLYRAISGVAIGDGEHACFWSDDWLGDGDLKTRFPALFSHTTRPKASVASVLRSGLWACLGPRLTTVGEREFAVVNTRIATVSLTNTTDLRALRRCMKCSGELSISELYKLCTFGGVEAAFAEFVWKNYAPSKVKFFMWLLVQSRIQSRAALLAKKIIQPADAHCPICSAPVENASHIVLGCSFARRFWAAIGAPPGVACEVHQLHALPSVLKGPTASTFTALCCWNIWKHRNGVVFNSERSCLHRLAATCISDAVLWHERVPHSLRADADTWGVCLRQALTM